MLTVRAEHTFSIIRNPNAARGEYGAEQAAVLNDAGLQAARREISTWPGYAPTPLVELPGHARRCRVAGLYYKDEGLRFGLGSFKPLGGAYAVFRVIAAEAERAGAGRITSKDLLSGKHRDIAATVTVCAATDGNHGRSVAWGARMFGCGCVIFINAAVTEGRQRAIASYGAQVRRVAGTFDDAVRAATRTADEEGWHVVPDTASGGNVSASGNVMQGYAILADELIGQLPDATPPSHLFVQAGVGGLAGAVAAQFWQAYGGRRPTTVTVEPESAGCWFESLRAGQPVTVSGELDSLMAGLACGEVSPLAWDILGQAAHAAMIIPDQAAAETMRGLAEGKEDTPLVGGESGVAGLAGFMLASEDADARALLGLDDHSRVVVIGSEADTDPETYRAIVGRDGDAVRAAAATGS
jgi:diaminopropionate ammonia-lyase